MKARVSLNLRRSLKTAAEAWARQKGISLNQFIACALAKKVGVKHVAAFLEQRGQSGDPERAAQWLEARPE
jgi:hypothetical protein